MSNSEAHVRIEPTSEQKAAIKKTTGTTLKRLSLA